VSTITIDFSDTRDDSVLEPGIYTAQVMDMYSGVSRANNPKVTIVFSLIDEGYEGTKVFADFFLTANAKKYLRKALIALGYKVSDMLDYTTINVDDLCGRQCRIVIENSIGTMGTYNKVRQVMPLKVSEDSQEKLDIDF